MDTRFGNSVVLVAGGTGALGSAVSRAFLAQGATVLVTYRAAQELSALSQSAGECSVRLHGYAVDVTDERATLNCVHDAVAQHERIDVLINSIGGYAGGSPSWQTGTEVLERMHALNLRALHVLLRAVVPVMLQRARGCIVSVAAEAAVTHPARNAVYSASKAAALALMGSLAAELAGTGIRANSILPRTIDTEANRRAMPTADFSTWVRPEDIADAVLYLCSRDAKAVHGAQLPVYGNR